MSGHRFACRVYFEDTDAGGVVYHANYLRFAERARTEALRDLGVPHAALLHEFGLIFVVRRIKLDYLRPARLDESLEVSTRVLAVAASRVELVQIVRREGETLVEAEVILACVRQRDGKPARIPPRWRDALGVLAAGQSEGRR
ncbi:MAG: tol-pal system-associated acyl-CoA thioesterase [Rhodospirillales bacterium]|nr:tol-pal system-associated acyl-CoA thioesterase [Rhodospirillales bacterium]